MNHNHSILEEHLAQTERHVAEGEATLARQRAIIAALERDRHDARFARALLRQFEEVQAMHVEGRARLRKELGLA